MTAKRYQAKRPVRLLAPGGVANRVVATTNGTTLAMQALSAGMLPTGAALGRIATRTVAASDASSTAKALADYVCDGVADQVEINAALADIATPGGVVLLSEGRFTLAAPVVLGAGWQGLRGMGMGATTLAAVNNGGAPLNVGLVQVAGNWCELADLTVDGNKANNAAQTLMIGVYVGATQNPAVRRVRVLNSAQHGLVVWNVARNGVIRDCLFEGSAALGVSAYAGAGQPLLLSGCVARSNLVGFYVEGGTVVLSDCQALANTYQGFDVHANADASLDRCTARGNGAEGFNLVGAIRTRLCDCRAITNVGAGFKTDAAQAQVVGCTASGTTGSGYGFWSAPGATDVLYEGCTSLDNADAGFFHDAAGVSSYVGCTALGNAYNGWRVIAGTARIQGCTTRGSAASREGVRITGGAGSSVDGCRIAAHGYEGVLVGFSASDVRVTNNAISESSLEFDQSYPHVSVVGDRAFVAGNTFRDPASGNRAGMGILLDSSSENSLVGRNDGYGITSSYGFGMVTDYGTNTRRVGKLQLDYTTSTDLMSGTTLPANTRVVVVPNQTFRVDNRDSIVEISVRGVMLAGGASGALTFNTFLVIDDGNETEVQHGFGYVEVAGVWQNPLAGGQPRKIQGMYTGPGLHTVRLEIRTNGALNAIGYLRGAGVPDYEFVGIQVMEYKV